MRIGIPGGLLYPTYKPFISRFFQELGLDVLYSTTSNDEILKLGTENCVDEACLPIKIFHGHVMKLQNECDLIAIPRFVNISYNQSVCPKFDGLPELVKSGTGKTNYIFTEPLYLYDEDKLFKALKKDCKRLGITDEKIKYAFWLAMENQRNTSMGIYETEYEHTVFLAGHPYHIYDDYVNMNIIEKLHKLGIGVITEEWIHRNKKREYFNELIKKPYWLFFMSNYCAARAMEDEHKIDGIVYLSSFCCGTDAFTIEMIKNKVSEQIPLLVVKLDEQRGEAGYDTRLEAFSEILNRKKFGNKMGGDFFENHISPHRGRAYYS